jgi:acetyl-CoA carboxylase carboxyl transferase subunit beta
VAKVIESVETYRKGGGLFVSILTNPVMGGVASIAMGADIVIAEKNSYIGLSGPRIAEQVVRHSLSKENQKAETLIKKGFIDIIAERRKLKENVSLILKSYNRWKI